MITEKFTQHAKRYGICASLPTTPPPHLTPPQTIIISNIKQQLTWKACVGMNAWMRGLIWVCTRMFLLCLSRLESINEPPCEKKIIKKKCNFEHVRLARTHVRCPIRIFTITFFDSCFRSRNSLSLRNHAFSNILKISPPKTESFQI